MSNLAVIGTHWGDEGKGKIVDLLAERFDVVARFQGGHNAGHSVIVDDKHYAFHLIPSGIIRARMTCVIGNGVVLDPEAFRSELAGLIEQGLDVTDRLFVSDRTHVIAPWHRAMERATEELVKVGTTLRGIGPAYMTKVERIGLRTCDLMNGKTLGGKVEAAVTLTNERLGRRPWFEPFDAGKLTAELAAHGEMLRPYVRDTSVYLHERMAAGASILFEGAQATLLDVDHGTYPYVTSSSSSAGGIGPGLGIGPRKIDAVLGVTKAYTTRVGEGPMPTELTDAVGKQLRERGKEYGVSTGRPRRCGWFDAVGARYSVRVNGIDMLALTLFDVLDTFDEIPIGVAYRLASGEVVRHMPADTSLLYDATVEYEMMTGWKTDLTGIRRYEDLPPAAKAYVERVEKELGAPVAVVSVGPARAASLIRDDIVERFLPRPEAGAPKPAVQ